MLHQPTEPIVQRRLQQPPIQRGVMIPFAPLAKLAAHKKKLFPRMTKHPRIKHPQIGKFLPHITRHFRKQGPFPMNNFVVTKNQNELLLESVEQREGESSMMKPAKDWIQLHVFQKVVHPAHVPFEAETQSA